jgi:hypothetical protein
VIRAEIIKTNQFNWLANLRLNQVRLARRM